MPTTYDNIASTTLTSSSANVIFENISSTYTDLVIFVIARTDRSGQASDGLNVKFNTDDGSNYSSTHIFGTGSAVSANYETNTSRWFITSGNLPASTAAADSFGTVIINLQNYSNTTTYKNLLARFSSITNHVGMNAGTWRSTSAINAITFISRNNANFIAGSKFIIYGIKAA